MPKPYFFAALLCCAFSVSEASVEPPKLRLGEDVRPVRYSVDLTLIPDEDTFSGAIEIDLDIRKPADVIWLNARSLTIDHANLVAGGRTLNAKRLSRAAKIMPVSSFLLRRRPSKPRFKSRTAAN